MHAPMHRIGNGSDPRDLCLFTLLDFKLKLNKSKWVFYFQIALLEEPKVDLRSVEIFSTHYTVHYSGVGKNSVEIVKSKVFSLKTLLFTICFIGTKKQMLLYELC